MSSSPSITFSRNGSRNSSSTPNEQGPGGRLPAGQAARNHWAAINTPSRRTTGRRESVPMEVPGVPGHGMTLHIIGARDNEEQERYLRDLLTWSPPVVRTGSAQLVGRAPREDVSLEAARTTVEDLTQRMARQRLSAKRREQARRRTQQSDTVGSSSSATAASEPRSDEQTGDAINDLTHRILEQRAAREQQMAEGTNAHSSNATLQSASMAIPDTGTTQQVSDENHSALSQAVEEDEVLSDLETTNDFTLAPAHDSIEAMMQRISTQRANLPVDTAQPVPLSTSNSSVAGQPPSDTVMPPEPDDCPICREVMSPSSYSIANPCGHIFDYACVMEWFERRWEDKPEVDRLNCPLCRRRVLRVNHQFDESRSTSTQVVLVDHFRNWTPARRVRRRSVPNVGRVARADNPFGRVGALPSVVGGNWHNTRRETDGSDVTIPGTQPGDYADDDELARMSLGEFHTLTLRRAEERGAVNQPYGRFNIQHFNYNLRTLTTDGEPWPDLPLSPAERQAARQVNDELFLQANQALSNYLLGRPLSPRDLAWGQGHMIIFVEEFPGSGVRELFDTLYEFGYTEMMGES